MSRPILEVKNVSCSLSKGHTIFENASFLVNERDVVVLTGKSGSGKVGVSMSARLLGIELLYSDNPAQMSGPSKQV